MTMKMPPVARIEFIRRAFWSGKGVWRIELCMSDVHTPTLTVVRTGSHDEIRVEAQRLLERYFPTPGVDTRERVYPAGWRPVDGPKGRAGNSGASK